MNRTTKKLMLFAWLTLVLSPVAAYELATHAKVTNSAYDRSRLGTIGGSLLMRIGIDRWTNNSAIADGPFRAKGQDLYYDLQADQPYIRIARSYELGVMRDVGLDQFSTTVRGWIMRGVIREDDGGLIAGKKKGEPLDAGDGRQYNRFCNHFLDPVRERPNVGRGFSGYCFDEAPVFDAATWVLGSLDTFNPLPYENVNRRNRFSVLDAREAMWRALTLRNANGITLSPTAPLTNEDLRKIYWATTFRTLGDVVHTLQDMGNPQHTRNEGHATKGYEEYIDARVRQEKAYEIDGRTLTLSAGQLPDIVYDIGYPIPQFNRYSDFWSTRINSANIFGLSDYSNRGFFTLQNNFGNTTVYTEPSSDPAKYTTFPVFRATLGGSLHHLVGNVEDKVTKSTSAVTMAVKGIFTGLAANGGSPIPPKYTLDQKSYDDRAAVLIPRAVAYSAGLIDYFFRGQMEIFLPAEGVYAVVDHSLTANNCKDNCGFTQLKLKVANSTTDIVVSGGNGAAIPQAMTGSGTLVAVAKYRKNTCYTADLEGEYDSSKAGESKAAYAQRCRSANEEITVSQPLTGTDKFPPPCAGNCEANARPLVFTFTPPIPINATDLYLQVVYRGPLGAEQDAVVVATKDIPEPTYFSLMNTTDYMVCSGGSYFYRNADGTGYPGAPLYPYQTWMAFQPDDGSSVGTAMARIDDLRPKEYVRVAALVDTGRTYARNIAGLAGPDLQLLSAVNTGLNQTNYEANGTSTADVFDFRINTFRKVKSHFAFTRVTGSTDCVPASPPAHAYPPEPAYPPHTPPAMRAVTIRPFS